MASKKIQLLGSLNTDPCWSDEAKRLLIAILRSSVTDSQLSNVNTLEVELFGEGTPDIETTAILGTGVLGKMILGRSA